MTGKEFAERIDFCLKTRNQSRKAITSDLGISSSTMSSWAAGRGSIPNANVVSQIAQYLNVSMDWLVTGKDINNYSENERALVARWRSLTDGQRESVEILLRGYEAQNAEKKSEAV